MARASAKGAVGERPFPPGDYPVVVVGSGPGAIQFSHELDRLGIAHATLSADPSPGGMFRRLPIYQRLLSWTKPYALGDPVGRAGEWYDWNSIVSDDQSLRSIMPTLMDGSSSFPSRANMAFLELTINGNSRKLARAAVEKRKERTICKSRSRT